MMRYMLMPMIQKFNALFPEIEILFDLSSNLYNLNQREADVAIRVTKEAIPEDLIGRKLGGVSCEVYGSREYLNEYHNETPSKVLK